MAAIRVKRGTRAQLDAAAVASGLSAGEPYLITDEWRMAIGTGEMTYQDVARADELPDLTHRPEILTGTASPPSPSGLAEGTVYLQYTP